MPVVTIGKNRFSKFMGFDVSIEDLVKLLPWIGLDLEEVGEDYVKVEYSPNRIDFCSYAGIARALKGFMGLEKGLPKYCVKRPEISLFVDEAVAEVRPFILAAVVRGVKLDEDSVIELMEMQEDIHWGIGRDRRKASMGIHNLNAVNPPFTYTAAEPTSVKFVPLGKTEEMTLKEILERHDKGVVYRHLIDWAPRYPLLVDRDGRVLSMPPIINGELTRVNVNTSDLLLDVTGTNYDAVEKSLNVLVTALADMGGTVEGVYVRYPGHVVVAPNLEPKGMKLRVNYVNKLLGLRLSGDEVMECLRRCRLSARTVDSGVLEVSFPAYRIDLLHEVDLVEEVALGYGYYAFKPKAPATPTVGGQHRASKIANAVRQIMVGLGFVEVMNFTLTNERLHYQFMRVKPEKPIRLANPISAEYSMIRQSLLPGLLKNLAENKHESFPQRLFEVSDVVKINVRLETMCERRLHVAAASSHSTANFTEIRSVCEALLANLGLEGWRIEEARHPSFLSGRVAAVRVKRRVLGILGEVHPEVLNSFGIENPTAALEIDLEPLAK